MGKIKVLDDLTIQKIAAGEIIDRPSSVVKELIENSLDANSNSIVVEIKDGGKKYIRITDNGDGIYEEDIANAFKSHSTSKLSTIEELYKINSFGFRGEALSSISSVSKIELITKSDFNSSGIQAFVEEGNIIKQSPIGCPKGTTIIVRDLFYNLPVRKEFLKSHIVEGNHITDIVYKLALGNYGVSFKYIRDNQIILNTSKNNNLRDNIYLLLGKEFIKNLIEIQFKNEDYKIYGYISNNQLYRGNRSHQYLYVNNRYVKNTDIVKIIEKKYKSLIPINRFPVFILFIDVDPNIIDINIHPTKEEIKFANKEDLNYKLEYLIGQSLKENLSVPRGIFAKEIDKKEEDIPLLYQDSFFISNLDEKPIQPKSEFIEKEENVLETTTNYRNNFHEPLDKKESNNDLKIILKRLNYIGIIFSTYILAEDALSDQVFIIDQHAAHERVLYEKYKREYKNEKVVVQQLLAPEVIELTDLEYNVVLENLTFLKQMGFMVEAFGYNSVIIRGVPLLFGKPQLKSLFLEIIDNIDHIHENNYEYKIDKIMKIACSNAIKGGDKVFNMEIKSLFEQLSQAENPYTCPHGRPTIIQLTKEDIEKEFKRIM